MQNGSYSSVVTVQMVASSPGPAILCSINVETDKAAAFVSSAVSDNPLIGDFNKSLRGADARVAMIIDRAAAMIVKLPLS